MNYRVAPVIGETGTVVRALVVDEVTLAMYEMMAPEADAQPVAMDGNEPIRTDVDSCLSSYMGNTTAFYIDMSRAERFGVYLEALEAADRMLAVDGEFVHRTDFTRDDWRDFDRALRVLEFARRSMRALPHSSVLSVSETAHQLDEQLQVAQSALERLALRPLEPRQASTSVAVHRDKPAHTEKSEAGANPRQETETSELEGLGLTDRVVGALSRGGISTVRQLMESSDRELLEIDGIGRKALEGIRSSLSGEHASDKTNASARGHRKSGLRRSSPPGRGLLGRGLTPYERRQLAAAGIGSIDQLAQTPDDDLLAVPGFGPAAVARVRNKVPSAESGTHRSRLREQETSQDQESPKVPQPTRHIGVVARRNSGGDGYIRDPGSGEEIWFSEDALPSEARRQRLTGRTVEYVVWKDRTTRKAIEIRLV